MELDDESLLTPLLILLLLLNLPTLAADDGDRRFLGGRRAPSMSECFNSDLEALASEMDESSFRRAVESLMLVRLDMELSSPLSADLLDRELILELELRFVLGREVDIAASSVPTELLLLVDKASIFPVSSEMVT